MRKLLSELVCKIAKSQVHRALHFNAIINEVNIKIRKRQINLHCCYKEVAN